MGPLACKTNPPWGASEKPAIIAAWSWVISRLVAAHFWAAGPNSAAAGAIICKSDTGETGPGPAAQAARPWSWPQVPKRLHESAAKGHPRFFVREILKG
jgi:hypothetical protein